MENEWWSVTKVLDSGQVAEEQKKAAAKRGEEKTQTSDAKFDAQFAFASGLAGAANQV